MLQAATKLDSALVPGTVSIDHGSDANTANVMAVPVATPCPACCNGGMQLCLSGIYVLSCETFRLATLDHSPALVPHGPSVHVVAGSPGLALLAEGGVRFHREDAWSLLCSPRGLEVPNLARRGAPRSCRVRQDMGVGGLGIVEWMKA